MEARFPGTRVNAFGHLGDGNVHFNVRAPAGAAPAWVEERRRGGEPLRPRSRDAAGGSISAEHGIGQMKRAELARLGDPARLDALRAIKRALDPGEYHESRQARAVPVTAAGESCTRPRSPIDSAPDFTADAFAPLPKSHGESDMATLPPPPPNLPIFYNNLAPLSSTIHSKLQDPPGRQRALSRQGQCDSADHRRVHHRAAPLSDRLLGRRQPVPLALMGLNDGVNVFVDDEGVPQQPGLHPGLCPPLSLLLAGSTRTPRSCRSASIRRAS